LSLSVVVAVFTVYDEELMKVLDVLANHGCYGMPVIDRLLDVAQHSVAQLNHRLDTRK